MRRLLCSLAVAGLAAVPAMTSASAASGPSWRLVDTGTDGHFRGLSVVDANTAWLGGYKSDPDTGDTIATYVLRTTDGGAHWSNVTPAGSTGLQFRDIEGLSAGHAVAMAAGVGTDSRLYETYNGGRSWTLAYTNHDPAAFYDCMDFINNRNGYVLSDPVNGKFRILETWDGGRSWHVQDPSIMPAAKDGEFAFAASGECLTAKNSRDVYFGTSAGRVFHFNQTHRTWTAAGTNLASGASAGIFALAFLDKAHGIATGGDYADPTSGVGTAGLTRSQGSKWRLAAEQPAGYRSGVSYLAGAGPTAIAVGLTGSDITRDGGRTWHPFDDGQFDTVDCTVAGLCMAAGDLGRVAVLQR